MEVPSEVLSHLYSRYVKFLESATKKLTSAHTRSATLNLQQRRRLQEKLNACTRLLGQLEKDLAFEQKLVRRSFVSRTPIFRCINGVFIWFRKKFVLRVANDTRRSIRRVTAASRTFEANAFTRSTSYSCAPASPHTSPRMKNW